MSPRRELLGRYFPYCQWCRHDGNCALRHCDFLGVLPGAGVDQTPYPGHENVSWHFSSFQVLGDKMVMRAQCTSRVRETNSIFLPLACECGTAIDGGFCQKFLANEAGAERLRIAEKLARERGIPTSEVPFGDLPPLDSLYRSAMDAYFPDFKL